eukprot:CAMPEP_0175144932 /NCGR_PEP_ID=MMETSP0087-20121206/14453_1 /TAXON_ID=136419 /ORGANISM="Unknown Unknown, Strain D1" /LENGTH=527 /DNA_ID=CAMNT_0016429549 /DNA_START=56 /DNA_END=1639 /DNA_ORIENTATION=+
MATDTLHEIARESSTEMSNLWQEIGTTAEEQNSTLETITKEIRSIYQNHMATILENKKHIEAEIQTARENVDNLRARLQVEPSVSEKDGTLREQLSKLNSQHEPLLQQTQMQSDKIQSALDNLHSIWRELGSPVDEDFKEIGFDLSDVRFAQIENKICGENDAKAERQQQVATCASDIKLLVEELCLEENEKTSLDHLILEAKDLKINSTFLAGLHDRKQHLATLKQQRETKVKEIALQITELWEKLGVAAEERQQFLGKHSGLGLSTVTACEKELERLQEMKKSMMQDLTMTCRAKIAALWAETYTLQAEQLEFLPYYSNCFSDENLALHEECLQNLEVKKTELAPILVLIEKREKIKAEMKEFKESEKDPNRFKIPGRLLKEEKFRKVIKNTFPKVNSKLKTGIIEWEKKYGKLVTNGEIYLDSIMADDQEPPSARGTSRGSASTRTAATDKDKENSTQPPKKSSTSKMPATKATKPAGKTSKVAKPSVPFKSSSLKSKLGDAKGSGRATKVRKILSPKAINLAH